MDGMDRTAVVYICWNCGEDFEVTGHDGLADSLEVSCPTDCERRGVRRRGGRARRHPR
jgi:DNA-directed RNA polymerase subunit RPC12/RpoP